MRSWIFDVDGVITDLYSKDVKYPQILDKIAFFLNESKPVGVITGRTDSTLERAIMEPLENLVEDSSALDLLCYQGEFGGLSITYSEGKKNINVDYDLSLPKELIAEGEEVINLYKDFVFFAPKQTFLTAEMHDEGDIEKFKSIQDELAQKLRELVDKFGLSKTVEVHNDQIAVNVKNKKLNKHLATKKYLNWLRDTDYEPEEFYVFGDNESDLEIGEELDKQGKKLEFIFVGDRRIGEYPFKVIKTKDKFTEGTLEFLNHVNT